MRLVFLIPLLMVLAGCAGAGSVNSVPVPAPSPSLPAQPFGHTGQFLTDATGRTLFFHGVNMVNKFPPYDLASIGFGEQDATLLQSSGFNVVRLGVIYAAVQPSPGQFDDTYLASIAATVAMLGQHGILSLIDFHQDQFGSFFMGEGFPDWSVFDNGLPLQPNFGFPDNYSKMPALQTAYDSFWNDIAGPGNVGLQERYVAAWAHVAGYFSNNAAVVGYDLFNEPVPGSAWNACATLTGCATFDQNVLSPFSQKTARAIQAVDSQHFIFYEPLILFDFGSSTSEVSPAGDRIGFSYHDYNPSNFALPLANALKQSATYGNALLMTEFGASATAAPVVAVADLADTNMLSWIYWAYTNKTPFQIIVNGQVTDPAAQGLVLSLTAPRSGSNVNQAVLTALARPYPMAIAGAPQSFAFNPASNTFDLTFTPGGASVTNRETDIAVPAASYPNGYKVTVTGCTIASVQNAAVLRVQAALGVSVATVHVQSN